MSAARISEHMADVRERFRTPRRAAELRDELAWFVTRFGKLVDGVADLGTVPDELKRAGDDVRHNLVMALSRANIFVKNGLGDQFLPTPDLALAEAAELAAWAWWGQVIGQRVQLHQELSDQVDALANLPATAIGYTLDQLKSAIGLDGVPRWMFGALLAGGAALALFGPSAIVRGAKSLVAEVRA